MGKKKKKHIEWARDLAFRLNNVYGVFFPVPELFIPPVGARVMGLQEPDKKMSKSDINENNYISLLDPPDVIRDKLKRAVTDSDKDVRFDKAKPGISNLLTIYSSISHYSITQLEEKYTGQGYGVFKQAVAEAVIDCLRPAQERFHALRNDEKKMRAILQDGAKKANQRAQRLLEKVYDVVGFINR